MPYYLREFCTPGKPIVCENPMLMLMHPSDLEGVVAKFPDFNFIEELTR